MALVKTRNLRLFKFVIQIYEAAGSKRLLIKNSTASFSVADPGCLSRIPDPDFYPSRIQKQQLKRRVKNFFLSNLFL